MEALREPVFCESASRPWGWDAHPRSLAAMLNVADAEGLWMILQMLQQSPVSIMVTSPDGVIEYVNERYTQITGYSRDEVIGQPISVLRSGLTPSEVYISLWETIPHGIWRGEFVNRKKNGEIYYEAATIGPIKDLTGRVAHYLSIKEDITERKRVEAENHLLKERFRLAAELSSDLVYELDVQTLQVSVLGRVREAWKIYGLPEHPDEWFAQIHHEDLRAVSDAYQRSMTTGAPFAQEYRSYRRDGGVNWWRHRAAAVRDENGNILRFVGALQDISGEKRTQQQLLDLADSLRAKNEALEEAARRANAAAEAKSRFIANMSHEVRTPLNGIIGTAEVLLQLQPTDEQRECAETIRDCGLSLLTVLNDVLDISKIEAGKIEIHASEYEPARVANDVVDLMRPLSRGKVLRVEAVIHGDVPDCVTGDADRIAQVLHNLVSNAIKFTTAGNVTLLVSATQDESGAWLEYAVRDTGMGIPEEKQSSVFESFVQLDASRTREFGGTGLGLAISQQLARLMHGDITVRSRVNEGSTFTLRLPLVEAAPRNRASLATVPATPTGPATILLAEDNPLNQRIVTRLLEKQGYRVNVANDGVAAVEAALREPPDLILMDIQMPRLDGLDATRRLRANTRFDSIPVIALTANAMLGDRELYLSAGMDDYLAKPISRSDLLARVGRWLARPAPVE
jgi:two-component system, sensor histidine kinase and response regulator